MTDLFGQATSSAVLSDCGTYRYELRRVWDPRLPLAVWIMLNPSVADASQDDPTIRRCVAFAKVWGYGGIIVVNLFALRATDPRELASHPDPVGPDNDKHIVQAATRDGVVVCAWGAHKLTTRRADRVLAVLRAEEITPRCLGTTKAGHPRHPLYVPASTPLVLFGEESR